MSPRTGRPTDEPKTKRMEVRLSVLDDIKLEYCRETLGLNKTEVVKKGIDMVYQQAVNLQKNKTVVAPSQSTNDCLG